MNRVASLSRMSARPSPRGLLSTLLHLDSLYRQRNHLSQLDDAALEDIGLTRAEAQAEARRPIWDLSNA